MKRCNGCGEVKPFAAFILLAALAYLLNPPAALGDAVTVPVAEWIGRQIR